MAAPRRIPDTEWEVKLGHPGVIVCGCDEVGRGCLAGPVVGAAVVLPEKIDFEQNPWLKTIADSKLLSPEKREELVPLIKGWVRGWSIGQAEVGEIDEINIHHASQLAMVRAIESVGLPVSQVLVDGKFPLKRLRCHSTAVVKGDQKCLSVACASIIAKVWRDSHMVELESVYPGYGFAVHKGYPTPVHLKALETLGVCKEHRRSFGPVASRLAAISK
jgi:ribonuclease HII